jgi:hypothetical protein
MKLQLSFDDDQYKRYRVLIGEGLYPQKWSEIIDADFSPEINLISTQIDVKDKNGLVVLQLQAIDINQKTHTDSIYLTIDNTPPSIFPIYPKDNEKISLTTAQKDIEISAIIKDNVSTSKCTFYLDNKSISTITAPPYITHYKASSGEHILKIQAEDQAGNISQQAIKVRIISPH